MELFAWLSAHQSVNNVLQLTAGPGHVTMKPAPGSYAAVAELVKDPTKGALLSGTAVARLHSGGELRYVMLWRGLDAPSSPGTWQIPAGRCSPGEDPNETAVRELAEEVGIAGVPGGWEAARVTYGVLPVVYKADNAVMELSGQWALHHNTYEFYVFVDLDVPAFEAVTLWDLEPYNREVRLMTEDELFEAWRTNKLADGSAAVVLEMLTKGQLAVPESFLEA